MDAVIKEIYCGVCEKWLIGYHCSRHVSSQSHKHKLAAYKKGKFGPFEKPSISATVVNATPLSSRAVVSATPSTSVAVVNTTPTKEDNQVEHYQIKGDTLKKCPHNHPSILHRCKYLEKDGEASFEEIKDNHWHVKQKLFEKEQEQQGQYLDTFQPTESETIFDSDDEDDAEQLVQNDLDSSREEQKNKSIFHFDDISDDKFRQILDGSDSDDSSEGQCDGFHDNQQGEYLCKTCNPKGYKEYVYL